MLTAAGRRRAQPDRYDLHGWHTGDVVFAFSGTGRPIRCYTEFHRPEREKRMKTVGLSVMNIQFRVQESGVKTHKYQVGQTVYFTSGPVSRPGAGGSYQILKLLP